MITAAQVDAEQELASLCGVLNASHARLVAIVAGALDDESWAIAGVRTPEHWLVLRAGLSPFHARQVVAVARRHGELPTVMGEFANGQLSLDQVSVVARYAPAHVEASVAEFAVNASVPQLRGALSQYSFDPPRASGQAPQDTTFGTQTGEHREAGDGESSPQTASHTAAGDGEPVDPQTSGAGDDAAANEAEAHGVAGDTEVNNSAANNSAAGRGEQAAGRGQGGEQAASEAAGIPPTWNGFGLGDDRSGAPAELSMSQDEYGRFTLRFSAPADLGALVAAALNEAKDALFGAGQTQATMGDAMVEMAQRSLGAVESINRRDAYRTYVHLDTEGGWLTGRPRLPGHIAKKLTCDGILQPIWHTQGAPVNVGRAQRIVPARTRRLVEDRDRGCKFPGCATTHVECHHLIHWVDGGPTDTWNLAGICAFHHDAHHNGDFTITGNADDPTGLTFTTCYGLPIRPGPTFITPTSPESRCPPTTQEPTPGSPCAPTTRSPGSTEPPGSAAPGSPGSQSPGAAHPEPHYRGPTGESFDHRWVTFDEPREPTYL